MGTGPITERYTPKLVAANATLDFSGNAIGCFLCTTTGNITVTANATDGRAQYNLLTSFPVTAGTYYQLPFYIGSNGGRIVAAGGAAGVLGVV